MAQLTAAQQQMNAMIAFAMQQEKALQELDASDGDDEEEAVPMAEPATEPEDEDRLVCDGNRETMNIEQRLYRNICLSKYYQVPVGLAHGWASGHMWCGYRFGLPSRLKAHFELGVPEQKKST